MNRGKGFAALTPEARKEIARRGGIAAQAKGTAHRWDREAARVAGRKGGLARHAPRERVVES